MNEAWYVRLGFKSLRFLDGAINLLVLILFLAGVLFGGYAIWDSEQLYREANAEHYEQYKPSDEDVLSFEELKAKNPDVFGWLTVYGTNIDYPLVQGKDNETYVNTNVVGEKVLSGSIFLDYRNQRDFSDFNNIIYGHHMDKQVMFGQIGEFAKKAYFEERAFGSLFYEGKRYGIEFFAFLGADAYDETIYAPPLKREANRQEYLTRLLERAMYIREIPVSTSDRLVLLSTCSSNITNGRHILVGRISNTVYDDPFEVEKNAWGIGRDTLWDRIISPSVGIVLIVIVLAVIVFVMRRRK